MSGLRFYSVGTSADKVEAMLHGMTDGPQVVAVEVFDTLSARYDDELGVTIGPWVCGPVAEVYTWLADHDHTDTAEQYSVGSDTHSHSED